MNVFRLELKNTWKSSLIWMIVLSAIAFSLLAFFPSMQTESMKELTGAKLEGMDPAILEAFGLAELTDFTVITNYFGYVLQYITLALMVYVSQSAVNLLVKEETDGTIEFLYAKPISRSVLFMQKALATILSFLLILVVLLIVTVIGYLSYSDYSFPESMKELSIIYGSIFYVGVVFISIGVLLSVLLKSSKGSSGIALGIVFGTFILGIVGTMVEKLNFLSYLSPIDWVNTQKLMTDGILIGEWVIGLLTIGIAFVLANLFYNRKDLRS